MEVYIFPISQAKKNKVNLTIECLTDYLHNHCRSKIKFVLPFLIFVWTCLLSCKNWKVTFHFDRLNIPVKLIVQMPMQHGRVQCSSPYRSSLLETTPLTPSQSQYPQSHANTPCTHSVHLVHSLLYYSWSVHSTFTSNSFLIQILPHKYPNQDSVKSLSGISFVVFTTCGANNGYCWFGVRDLSCIFIQRLLIIPNCLLHIHDTRMSACIFWRSFTGMNKWDSCHCISMVIINITYQSKLKMVLSRQQKLWLWLDFCVIVVEVI